MAKFTDYHGCHNCGNQYIRDNLNLCDLCLWSWKSRRSKWYPPGTIPVVDREVLKSGIITHDQVQQLS